MKIIAIYLLNFLGAVAIALGGYWLLTKVVKHAWNSGDPIVVCVEGVEYIRQSSGETTVVYNADGSKKQCGSNRT